MDAAASAAKRSSRDCVWPRASATLRAGALEAGNGGVLTGAANGDALSSVVNGDALYWCCCLARARHCPRHQHGPSCFSSPCFGEQCPLTVQNQLCSGAAQQWMSISNISRNNGVLLIPVRHHHLSSKAQPLFSGNHP